MAITSINLGKIKFNWRGAWALGTDYVKDDVVRYSGSSYVCVTGHTSATSWATNSSKFELMAEGTTPTTTEGDIIVRGVTVDERLGVGNSGQVLTVEAGVPIWKDNGVNDKIYYVSPDGSDSNSGQSWGTAFATIKHACDTAIGPATVYVSSGTFYEALPITVPSFVAVVGDNQRTTIISPDSGYEQTTMWKLGDGALLNKMCFVGLTGYVPYAPDDKNIELATIGGVYVAFDSAVPIATKSPYIIECTAKSAGGVGALLDGSLHATGNKSMVFHGYTVILDSGVGYWVSDNAKSEIVSCFTYFCHVGYAATGGGKIRALNGNNSYGTYGSLASGYNLAESTLNGSLYGNQLEYTPASLTGGSFTAGETITGSVSGATGVIQNVQAGADKLYYKIATGGPFQVGETINNGAGVTAVIATGGVSGQKGFVLVVTGLTAEPKPGGSIEFTTGDTTTYVIQSVSGWTNSSSKAIIVLAGEKTVESLDGVNIRIRYDYSNIRLTGHDFLSIGTGGVLSTNYPGAPLQASAQGNEVIELFPARVFYVSTDQDGNFRVGEYFKVDQATGRATLNASAFDLSGLTSLKLGSIGAQLGELVNEFSSDETLSGNSNSAVPTEKAVKQYFTKVSSNIVPSVTDLYTLGTSSILYDKIYVNKVIGPATLIIDPAAEGNDTGTVQIKGNLQVDGTTTTINSTTLSIDDKNIVLADGSTLDSQADGAGITVKGTTDKTLNWVDATDAWTSSEDFNLLTGKQYEINGTSVLSATTLGSGVTGSSLTSVGTLSGGLNIAASQTYKVNSSEVLSSSKLTLNGSSSGTVAFQAAASAGSITYTLPSADAAVSGYALVSNASGTLSWAAAGATLSDDTTTTALYPTMSTATSGSLTTAKITSTKLTFNAATGVLASTGLSLGGVAIADYSLYKGLVARVANGAGIGINSSANTDNAYIYFGYGTSSGDMQGAAIGRIGGDVLRIYTSATARAQFDSTGLTVTGNILPDADNTRNLGAVGTRWANIYTGDLHLSNETKAEGNAVDGTTGNWTIQEGAEDLFIINNKSGKKYKFSLTEVS